MTATTQFQPFAGAVSISWTSEVGAISSTGVISQDEIEATIMSGNSDQYITVAGNDEGGVALTWESEPLQSSLFTVEIERRPDIFERLLTTLDEVGKELEADNSFSIAFLTLIGAAFSFIGEHETALRVFDHIVERDKDPDMLYNKLAVIFEMGRYSEVLRFIDDQFERNRRGMHRLFFELQAYAFAKLGRYEEALEVLNRLIRRTRRDSEERAILRFKASAILERLGRYDEAYVVFRDGIHYFDSDIFAAGRDPSAEHLFVVDALLNEVDSGKKNQIADETAELLLAVGEAFNGIGEHEKALRVFETVLKLSAGRKRLRSERLSALYGRVKILQKLGREDEALSAADEAARELPSSKRFPFFEMTAGVLAKLKRYGEALKAIDDAIKRTPAEKRRRVHLHLERAVILERLGLAGAAEVIGVAIREFYEVRKIERDREEEIQAMMAQLFFELTHGHN